MAGRGSHLVERAVHPVADLELRLEGLEVNVARAVGNGLIEDEIDEADDRRGVGFLRDDLSVELVVADVSESHFRIFSELGKNVLHGRGFGAVVLRDQVARLSPRMARRPPGSRVRGRSADLPRSAG